MNKREYGFRKYITPQEINNALSALEGILLGVSLDKIINDKEVEDLLNWSKENYHLVDRTPFWEIKLKIRTATVDIENRNKIVAELLQLCQLHQTSSDQYSKFQIELNALKNICRGILSDGIINEKEIAELNIWLQKHSSLQNFYPYDEIKKLIQNAKPNQALNETKQKLLKQYFSDFANENILKISAEQNKKSIEGFFIDACTIDFRGKSFVLSRKLPSRMQKKLNSFLTARNATLKEGLCPECDYLIVNPADTESDIVKKAIQMRLGTYALRIVRQEDIWALL